MKKKLIPLYYLFFLLGFLFVFSKDCRAQWGACSGDCAGQQCVVNCGSWSGPAGCNGSCSSNRSNCQCNKRNGISICEDTACTPSCGSCKTECPAGATCSKGTASCSGCVNTTDCYYNITYPSPTPTIVPTPSGGGSCDPNCGAGVCGFKKSDGTCTTDNGCCHRVCSGSKCVTIAGGGNNGCNVDSDCGGSSSPTCNYDEVTLSVSPNPVSPGQDITFSISGDASTYISDDYGGGVSGNCSGSWDNITCTATSTSGTYTWTHKWKNCVGSINNCSSECSESVSYEILSSLPSSPTGLSGSCDCALARESNCNCNLDWNDVTGATKYALRVNDLANGWSNTCDWTYDGDVCINVTSSSYSFTGKGGHSYSWWVHAVNAGGWSDAAYGTNFSAPYRPAAPSGLSASCASSGSSATVSWNSVSGADRYALRVDDKADGWDGTCSSPAGDFCRDLTGTSYTFSLTPGHSYRWWVHAVNGCDWSAPVYGSDFTCLRPCDAACNADSECATGYCPFIDWQAGNRCRNRNCPTDYDCVCDGAASTCEQICGGNSFSCGKPTSIPGYNCIIVSVHSGDTTDCLLPNYCYCSVCLPLTPTPIPTPTPTHTPTPIPTPTPCVDTAPDAATHLSDGTFQVNQNILLSWKDVSNWGLNCTGNNNRYFVYYCKKGDVGCCKIGDPGCFSNSVPKTNQCTDENNPVGGTADNSSTAVFSCTIPGPLSWGYTYYWKVVTSNGALANEAFGSFEITHPSAWWQTRIGDVYGSEIFSPIWREVPEAQRYFSLVGSFGPQSGLVAAPNCLGAECDFGEAEATETDFSGHSGLEANFTPLLNDYSYDQLAHLVDLAVYENDEGEKASYNNGVEVISGVSAEGIEESELANPADADKIIYYYSSDSGSVSVNSPLTIESDDKKLIIFIDGDLHINENITVAPGFLAFIVSGNIEIASNVTQVQGVYFADGSLTVESVGNTSEQRFDGQGIFVAKAGVSLKRDFGDNRNLSSPTEVFTFDPAYFFTAPKVFREKPYLWREMIP